ncbi:MAG: C40 family peptidase, partial [Spirochaetales bacterium]|nr:C40 family peptidase [Spirochaetales bacterium]
MKKILVSAICILAVAATAFGQAKRMAVTTLSENMLRLKPDYESPLETQALMGTIVEIIGEEGYWRQVVTPEPYTAWCTNLGLVEMTSEQINEYKAAPKYICTAQHSGVYASPSLNGKRLSDLSMGNLLRVVHTDGKKPKPSVKKKWAEVMLPDGRKGWTPVSDLAPFAEWAVKQQITADSIVNTALQFEGTPYLWGGASSKGLDCSGLVRLTFLMNGNLLPRNASQQVNYGREIIMECNHD